MKKIILLLFLCNSVNLFSQEEKTYIKLKFYKLIYKKDFSKNLDYKIDNNDTLIGVRNFSEKVKNIPNVFSAKRQETFISIRQFRRLHPNKKITKFILRNGDTLVKVDNKHSLSNRISIPYEPQDSIFLEAYKDIAFHRPLYINNKDITMKYWKNPIKIFFGSNVSKKIKKEIAKFAKHISKNVDSLNINVVNDIDNSNYLIYARDNFGSYNYKTRIPKNVIDYYIFWNGKQQIYDAKLQVDNKHDKTTLTKIKRLFLRSLGNFRHTNKVLEKSYFSIDSNYGKKLKKFDLKIVQYHYSYGISKGTSLKSFEKSHKKAKEVYQKTGKHLRFVHN